LRQDFLTFALYTFTLYKTWKIFYVFRLVRGRWSNVSQQEQPQEQEQQQGISLRQHSPRPVARILPVTAWGSALWASPDCRSRVGGCQPNIVESGQAGRSFAEGLSRMFSPRMLLDPIMIHLLTMKIMLFLSKIVIRSTRSSFPRQTICKIVCTLWSTRFPCRGNRISLFKNFFENGTAESKNDFSNRSAILARPPKFHIGKPSFPRQTICKIVCTFWSGRAGLRPIAVRLSKSTSFPRSAWECRSKSTSFPRSAWECRRDAPRSAITCNRTNGSGCRSEYPCGIAGIERGASEMHSHAERGNERGIAKIKEIGFFLFRETEI